MYEFSVPMPYDRGNIDKLIDLNTKIEKSKITSLYASLPSTCDMFTEFEQKRNFQFNKTNFDFWKDLFSYSLSKGMDFIYLLNSPLPFDLKNPSFNKQLEKLDNLLSELKKLGINKLRVANPQLMSYLGKYYTDFNINASTSLDYKTICEYQNFIMLHKEIKQIVPSHDINKNFKLLKNIKHDYPDLDIEIMVNEGCMKGCPHRNLHENINYDNTVKKTADLTISGEYCLNCCNYIMNKYPFYSLTLNNNIFPWEIEEYSQIGINKFKLVGRDAFTYRIKDYLDEYYLYFKAIDDSKYAEDISIITFIHHLLGSYELSELKTKDIKHLLPRIEHFKKYGHLCASRCGVECRYCYKCAEKIQKVFEKKQEAQRKRTTPCCIISK